MNNRDAKALDYLVLGAGAIGCYTGGWLARDRTVALLGRASILDPLRSHGLELESVSGSDLSLPAAEFESGPARPGVVCITESPSALSHCKTILVCVKSASTDEAVEQIQKYASPGATVISLQNGLGAARILKENLKDYNVLAGMVTYNVVRTGNHFRQSTSGPLMIELPSDEPKARVARMVHADMEAAGIEAYLRPDMENVQWSKLLLNLNNGINALAGVPIREMLSNRAYRRIIASCMKEAIHTYKKAGIKLVRLGKILPGIAPAVLGLPDFLFFRVASTMINIDPTAMTSLAQDLIAGKKTEIDFINGEVVRLARSLGMKAPLNAAVVQLVKEAEEKGSGSPKMPADAMARELGLS
tara:strand:+ start:35029 stop:36105 length:1077 start_codon:yes stop_codon:yes gene_type:complete